MKFVNIPNCMYNFIANYPKASGRPGSRARETAWKVEREKEKRMVLEENRLAEREYSRQHDHDGGDGDHDDGGGDHDGGDGDHDGGVVVDID